VERTLERYARVQATRYHALPKDYHAREEDVKAFAELIGQKITYKTDTLWFPKLNLEKPSNFIYTDEPDISRLHNLERSVGEEANEQCPRENEGSL